MWAYTSIIPGDPWLVPQADRVAAALDYVRSQIHQDSDSKAADEVPTFLCGIGQVFSVCPACGAKNEFDWVIDVLSDHWDRMQQTHDRTALDTIAPCCSSTVSVLDAGFPDIEPGYEFAGFSRVFITLTCHRAILPREQREEIVRLLGCPIKLLRYEL